MLYCDGTRHGPPMKYASSMKPTEVSDSTEIRSNINLDEKYLKCYHWYAWSLQLTGWGSSQAHKATVSSLHLPASASIPESNECFKYRDGESDTDSSPSSQWKLCCFIGHFQQRYTGRIMLAVTHIFMILSANAALVNLIPFRFASAVVQ